MLEELGRDVDRLAWVGAVVARGDACLPRYAAALRGLGEKVPALGKLGERVAALQASSDSEAPGALVQLGFATRQVLAAQPSVSPPRSDGAKDVTAGLDSREMRTAPSRELGALVAGTRSRKHPTAALRDDLEHLGVEQDPRSWPVLLAALGLTLWRELAQNLLAKAPESALRMLEQSFNAKGGELDGHKLRALAQARREHGEALYRESLRAGSAPVQVAAIESLRYVSAAAFDDAAFAYFAKLDTKAHLDWALVFGVGGTPRSIRAGWEILEAAHRGGTHGYVLEPIWKDFADLLDEAGRQQLWDVVLPKVSANQLDSFVQSRGFMLKVRSIPGAPLALLLRHQLASEDAWIRESAAQALEELGTPEGDAALLELARPHESLARWYLRALFRSDATRAYDELHGLFAGASASPRLVRRAYLVLELLGPGVDGRWLELLLSLVTALPSDAIPALGKFEDPRIVPLLLEQAARGSREAQLFSFDVLAERGIEAARPLILRWLELNPTDKARGSARNLLAKLSQGGAD